jgi:histone deacetylase 1/2
MATRPKHGIVQPRLHPTLLLTELEPTSYKTALKDPKWLAAMKDEYNALLNNNTWTLTPLPSDRKVIGCKWVFRIKQNPDGSILKYKARLVAKGFHQQHGFDFTETFSPVVKPITVRTVLTIAISRQWHITQLDVNNAFLNGILEEEVYMQQPPGFVNSDPKLVCKLNKALYGLKQAPRAWFERLNSVLHSLGFVSSRCDPSLFTLTTPTYTIFMLVYVDDIIITGSSLPPIKDLISNLNAQFSLKQLGNLDYFLGIEVSHLSNGSLFLSQTKYIRDLLTKTNMHEAKSMPTPMVGNLKLSKAGSDYLQDPTMYRSVVGALQYATITRPEISFSVNKACQFLSQPLESHWTAVKRILRYLRGTLHYGLQLHPAPVPKPLSLIAFSDADWGADPDDRKSTSGSCIYLGPNLVSWWSKKQTLVARSSTEAEYRALANTAAEVLWLQSLLTELKVPFTTPILYCDNMSTVALSHNPVLHAKTKHMELDIFFLREKVLSKSLIVRHVPATHQYADLLTKPLSPLRFLYLRDKLRVMDKSSAA